jgi:hypothetical protein
MSIRDSFSLGSFNNPYIIVPYITVLSSYAEVMLKEGELQCLLDERADCVHVGFVYSLPELYNMNYEIKAPPRSAYGDIS